MRKLRILTRTLPILIALAFASCKQDIFTPPFENLHVSSDDIRVTDA